MPVCMFSDKYSNEWSTTSSVSYYFIHFASIILPSICTVAHYAFKRRDEIETKGEYYILI